MTQQYGIVYKGTAVIPVHADTNKFGQSVKLTRDVAGMFEVNESMPSFSEHIFSSPIDGYIGFGCLTVDVYVI